MADDGGNIVMLMDIEQLKKLALLLRNQEEALMTRVVKSQNERVKYIKSVNDVYDQSLSLLDGSTATRERYAAEGGDKAQIAEDALDYVKYGLNFGMQSVRNCALRLDCIGKISHHYDSVASELATLQPDDLPNIRRLADEMVNAKKAMKEYCNNTRSASSRALSKLYSSVIKQEGIKFPDLINKHKNKLGFEAEFEHLTDEEKLRVYNSVINESGRASMPTLEMISSTAGVAVLAVAASLMVWDIFTAEHKVEATIRNTVSVLGDVGAFAVQVMVEGAVTDMVADVGMGVFIVSLAGLVTGLVAGLVFAAIGGGLLELIMGTGGSQAPPVTDLKFHTGDMPDGMKLARIISREG